MTSRKRQYHCFPQSAREAFDRWVIRQDCYTGDQSNNIAPMYIEKNRVTLTDVQLLNFYEFYITVNANIPLFISLPAAEKIS